MKKLLIFVLLPIVIFAFSSLSTAQDLPESSAQLKVLFSPQDNCAREIVSEIEKAKNSIDVAMYFFTSRPLAQAIIGAKDRGVKVRICLGGDEESAYEKYSKSDYLIKNGIDVKLIKGSGIMHNKFCIIDDFITITGSYNWTIRADLENDENVIIIKSREIAKRYEGQFNKLWNGTNIDTCVYKDKTRLEKVPAATAIAPPITMKTPTDKGYVGSKDSNKFHRPGANLGPFLKAPLLNLRKDKFVKLPK